MSITYRPGTLADSRTVYEIFHASIDDFSRRANMQAITGGNDPNVVASLWETRKPMFDHLAVTAEHFWIAEDDGRAIGYARSILRDGSRELTEFFVLPGSQSGGVGRELLRRAFPADGARHRTIVATIDTRAQARYLKSGVYPRFPIYYFERQPEPVTLPTDLSFEPVSESPETLTTLREIDMQILGYRRDIDHAWIMTARQCYLYRRDGKVVGYGYSDTRCGPIALLKDADFPAVLAWIETNAHSLGAKTAGFEVPMINITAVKYLIGRGYQLDSFFAFFMTDKLDGKLENYIVFSPPFFI
jgi:GNAT superfamily N-acetyltransferase